jgi:Ulp1 family protease
MVHVTVFSSRPLSIAQQCSDMDTCILVEGRQLLAPVQLNGRDCGCYVLHNLRALSLFATDMPVEHSLQDVEIPAYPVQMRESLAHECLMRCLHI